MQAAPASRRPDAPRNGRVVIEIDRYLFRSLLGPFAFFAIVLTGLVWLTQSLNIIDTVVNRGQSAIVFAELTILLLPPVLAAAMPISAFAATLYTMHRLYAESEIVVMLSAGMSALRLAKPIALFGTLVTALLYIDTLYLMPASSQQMKERVAELRGDLATALIRDGRFLNPAKGLTVYVKEIPRSGEMIGVFAHDQREPKQEVTYTAKRAALLSTEEGPRLVMFDGIGQSRDAETGELSILRFDRFVYDMTEFVSDPTDRRRKPSEHFFWDLINPPEELSEKDRGKWLSEGYEQLSAPLYSLALPLVALAILLGGGHRRRGYERRIAAAAAVAIMIRLAGFAIKGAATGSPVLAPALFAPPVLAIAVACLALAQGSRARAPLIRAPNAGGAA